MIDQAVPRPDGESMETVLRVELARGDAMAGAFPPILRHLITAGGVSIFSEEILARVRAMLTDLAGELLDALVGGGSRTHSAGETDVIGRALVGHPALLAHLHASALEWQLTERMQAHLALDPVMSPLLHTLLSVEQGSSLSNDGIADAFVAAQVRWCQAQRRMKLPLQELPAELFNLALYTLRALAAAEPGLSGRATEAENRIRRTYDEATTRLTLAAHLAASLDDKQSLLSIGHAGIPLFLTTLALGSGQHRDAVVLSTNESQVARFALALRAAGLTESCVKEQFFIIHPDMSLPDGFDRIAPSRAAEILSAQPGYI